MRIVFRRKTNDRHVLEIVRDDGDVETVECETRSFLLHDLLHYAIEAEAGTSAGVWGAVHRGRTLASLSDRTQPVPLAAGSDLAIIELLAGTLSGLIKGRSPEVVHAAVRDYAASIGTELPPWFSGAFVEAVHQRVRRLIGQWRATEFGRSMELPWPP